MAMPREGGRVIRHAAGFLNVPRGQGNSEIRRNFWLQRVADPWNSLPDEVKQAESLDHFKNGIDNILFKVKNGR